MATETETWERERLLEALDSYERGLSDAPYIQKWADKSTGRGDEGPMSFVVSTDEVDRHGDTISVEGWRYDAYIRNPVFLWAHNYTRPAIGRAIKVWKEQHSLLAEIEFAPTDFAQEVAALYRAGYQSGVSVGFRPMKYTIRRDPQTGDFLGINFTEQELLEISASPVPANQNALRKALDSAPRMKTYYYRCGFGEQGAPLAIPWRRALEEILSELCSARK